MKISEKIKSSQWLSKDRRGVALVTVLTVMALTTILVLTFFSLATSEHRASSTYSNGLQAQQVAEQAVNMVIAQIRQATGVGNSKAWASQPGAIRVWGDESGNGSSAKEFAYKLYSDDMMKTKDWDDFRNDFRDLENWSQSPSHYVDLNEPVIRGKKVYYPIVHPLASTKPNWPKPLGDDQNGVEGFWYNHPTKGVKLADPSVIGQKAAAIAQSEGHVAMPVMWVYQLADGTLGVLEKGSPGATSYRFKAISPGGTPSAKNPIVARFAFWADDETTKLNINTHAGGLAWDVPKVGGELDMNMAKYQPAQKEWQRYPGHPASTHLIPALAPGVTDIVNDRDAMEMLYKVVPRVVGGGSESGTRLIDTRLAREANGLIADKEPLFPSLDDMIMKSDRTPHKFPDAKGRPIPPEELSEYLERSKFFVTVNSRAPETNMFNKPRIAIWPIYNAPYGSDASGPYQTRLTAFDRLIHYCASMGKTTSGGTTYPRYEYIFKREKADSATYDAKIPRNDELYRYLVDLMNQKVPGYGRSFVDKYGTDGAPQLMTLIFDYIRTTNLHDDTLYSKDFQDAFQKKNTSEHLTYTNPRDGNKGNFGFGLKGHWQVTPSRIDVGGTETKGMGRFFSLAGAEVIVGCVAEDGGSHPLYPGVSSYKGLATQPPSAERAYTNLPPLPVGAEDKGSDGKYANKNLWPQWLIDLEPPSGTTSPEFEAAFDKVQWNWSLALADPGFAAAVLSDPTANRFNRNLINPTNCQTMRLLPDEKVVQAIFGFDLFSPSLGWSSINPNMQIEIEADNGMTFQGGAVEFLGWSGEGVNPNGDPKVFVWATNWIKPHREGGVRAWGGLLPFTYAFQGRDAFGERIPGRASVWQKLWDSKDISSTEVRSRLTPLDRGYNRIENALGSVKGVRDIGGDPGDIAQAYRYDLVTVPFKISNAEKLNFDGGQVTFRIYDGGEYCENSYQDDEDEPDSNSLVQTVTVDFGSFGFQASQISMPSGRQGHVNEFNALSNDSTGVLEEASMTADSANPWGSPKFSARLRGGPWNTPKADATERSYFSGSGNPGVRGRMASSAINWDGRYLRGEDIVQSVAVPHGDMRLVAAKATVVPSDNLLVEHRKYGSSDNMAHSLTNAEGDPMPGFRPAAEKDYLIVTPLPKGDAPYRGQTPLPFAKEKSTDVQLYGDFDNGSGTMIDGPYINKPDEGNTHALKTRFEQEVQNQWEALRNFGDFPYFSNPSLAEAGGPAYFSPNRIVSGPGMFGSLPTASLTNPPKPWQTLLFRPDIAGNGYTTHPGAESPPDHLIMDLFWMPVVEPYAISEPLSTGGKVNMNYEIVPFFHVHRDTALRGVFRSEFMVCIPNALHHSYKHNRGRGKGYHWKDNPFGGAIQTKRLRSIIVEDKTLAQFDERFDNGREIFKSATEICEIHLVPEEVSTRLGLGSAGSVGSYTPSVDEMKNGKYWRDHSLVGDNSRERPYTNIQTRLTTKSNTFLVHYRAQVVKQARRDNDSEYEEWRPELDSVQAEYRGSSMVERYVDPNSEVIPDLATKTTESLDKFYSYRVVNPRRFAP